MDLNTVLLEKDQGIGIITLNDFDSMNVIDNQFLKKLSHVIDEIEQDEEIKVVILTGTKETFSAGGNIKEVISISTPSEVYAFFKKTNYVFNRFEDLDKPTIAAVSGYALGGGCELALLCDIRIAADNARFGLSEIKIGVIPGGGGTQRLPRLVGIGKAKELLYTGDYIDAAEAYRIGLVNKVVPVNLLMEEAKKMSLKLSKQPAFALKVLKACINKGINMDLKSAVSYEARSVELLFSTDDRKEGMKAFLEKRAPLFKDS